MNPKNVLEGIEGNVGNVSHNIDPVMAANTQESQEHNNNNYESCVDSNNIAKKGASIMPNIDIENNVGQDRWDYCNEYNEWEGRESKTMTNQKRIECLRTMSVMTELEMMK